MHYFVIDENAKDREDHKYLAYKRHFWSDMPRLVLSCRLFGHKPERVDLRHHGFYYQCARCGTRPEQQSAPTPPWQQPKGGAHLEWWVLPKKVHDSFSVSFRVGNPGSENGFKGHVTTPVAAVYWGLDGYGERFRKFLNDDHEHYETREFQVSFHDGRLYTKIWAKTNSWSRSDPKWQQMSWSPADTLFGKAKNSHEVIETEQALVPMPEGNYPATVKLERWERWRPRGRTSVSYSVDIKIDDPIRFIPVPGKGENSWDCGDDGVYSLSGGIEYRGAWVPQAISMIVKSALRDRERYASRNWTPDAGWSDKLVKA